MLETNVIPIKFTQETKDDALRLKEILESNLKVHKSLTCGICSNRVSIPEKMIYYYF